ncbi:amidase [Roseococcus sp. SYP-B2431]|uniref:amidase n=1 Tax=Roseococcus sp. SYP-B2431 TaxID=2496640 RepID=UPI0010393281|nr:amidase [Roseococcus sp. SYP-B2431]TCH97676.1 amidase [Roseococcus sp. SYP-B2431]
MPRHAFPTIADAAQALETGSVTAAALVEEALARMGQGEGPAVFTEVHAKSARDAALAMDQLRLVGRAPSRFAGIPITIKDLFDEAGHVSRAGSVARDGAAPAAVTAPVVARLQRQGFVVLGRTNMTEFAFSGLGVNPHFGTPRSPWDRETGRLPGGSSSGAGVAAADGMGFGGLGTDTGGSCRIPAALNGVVGFKPTARRVPLDGAVPLSFSLDSVGPLARSVACCHVLDAFIAGAEEAPALPEGSLAGLRFGILHNIVEEGMEGEVARPYARALALLEQAGAKLVDLAIPELERMPQINAKGGLTASEAHAWHRELIASDGPRYDPLILKRILRGEKMTASDYLEAVKGRAEVIAGAAARTAPFDAVLCPTVPLAPPPIAAVAEEGEYNRINLLLLRNTTIANFLDRCAISLPCHLPGEAPAGLMLMGEAMADARLFAIAVAVERILEV